MRAEGIGEEDPLPFAVALAAALIALLLFPPLLLFGVDCNVLIAETGLPGGELCPGNNNPLDPLPRLLLGVIVSGSTTFAEPELLLLLLLLLFGLTTSFALPTHNIFTCLIGAEMTAAFTACIMSFLLSSASSMERKIAEARSQYTSALSATPAILK